MEKFAFIIHPLSIHDMAHVSPVLKFIPDSWLESALKLKKPFQGFTYHRYQEPLRRSGRLVYRLSPDIEANG